MRHRRIFVGLLILLIIAIVCNQTEEKVVKAYNAENLHRIQFLAQEYLKTPARLQETVQRSASIDLNGKI
ncbi:MAG: hypothetical protein ACOX3A_10260 [bacterium]|jgi:hypothetical protein